MNRILQISYDDLLYDKKAAEKRINDYCAEHAGTVVVGATTSNEKLLVIIEERDESEEINYVIAPAEADSYETLISSIRSRYDAGFSTITTFSAGDILWGLYAKSE